MKRRNKSFRWEFFRDTYLIKIGATIGGLVIFLVLMAMITPNCPDHFEEVESAIIDGYSYYECKFIQPNKEKIIVDNHIVHKTVTDVDNVIVQAKHPKDVAAIGGIFFGILLFIYGFFIKD